MRPWPMHLWPGRLWPDSLMGRTLLVLLLGVLGSNLVGVAVYSDERLTSLIGVRGRQIAEQVASGAAALEQTPLTDRRRLSRSLHQPGLRLFWSDRPSVEDEGEGWRVGLIRDAFVAESGEDVGPRLRLSLGPRMRLAPQPGEEWEEAPRQRRLGPGPGWAPGVPAGGPELTMLLGSYRLNDSTWLNFAAPIATFQPFWGTRFFLVIVATTAVVLAISVWAVRRATQPLAMFALAADRLGRGVDAPPLAVGGPREVRQAATAFNRMQERLQRFVRDRTQMLGALSHDLRTPITRLRLRAELIEDEEQQRKMLSDLEDMRSMIEATLAFARDEAGGEPAIALDLAVMLQTICDEAADAGAEVAYAGPAHASFIGRPGALRRAFANLVDNAVKYGQTARLTLAPTSGTMQVTIDDTGPGIPDEALERVFEPFYRLESSRSRETGGVGLGLALVRSVVASHGGAVALTNRSSGGLRVDVHLPITAPSGSANAGAPLADQANERSHH